MFVLLLNKPSPTTCNLTDGAVVPIPIFPLPLTTNILAEAGEVICKIASVFEPEMWSFAVGDVVPIPTLPPAAFKTIDP